jgi:hypothetical protein
MKLKQTGWLFLTAGALALIGCKSGSSSNNYQTMECTQGTESLGLDLKDQAARFTQDLQNYQSGRLSSSQLIRSANQTADLCWEFDNAFDENSRSCLSSDAFSGNTVEIQRDTYRYECDLADQYAESSHHSRDNSRDHGRDHGHDRDHRGDSREGRGGWADQSLKNLQPREIALSVTDSKTLSDVLRYRKNPKAFVNGQAVSYAQAQAAAQKGQTSCAIRVSNGRFTAGKNLPVVKIDDRSQRGIQSYTLVTDSGLQASCQTASRQDMTARDVQQALGSVIQVRH